MRLASCLQLALLIALGVPAVGVGDEPNVVFGAGAAITCTEYVKLTKEPESKRLAAVVLSWVQGYFSARNTVGRQDHAASVGGTISAHTLDSMLIDQCGEPESQSFIVAIAAERLYEKLQAKGL